MRDVIARAKPKPPSAIVVADMEAGLEHLSWGGGTLAYVDLLLIVAEPCHKPLLTAARTEVLARQLGIADIAVVANRVPPERQGVVERFAADRGLDVVGRLPDDPAVRAADRAGAALLDQHPQAPAAVGLAALADRVADRLAANA